MSFLMEMVIGVAASAVSALFGHFFSDSRPRLPKFFGSLTIAETRTAAAGVLGITLSAGIGLSTSDHSHRMLSYVLWYGIALTSLIVVIVCTVLDRLRGRSNMLGRPAVRPSYPSLPMSHPPAGVLVAAPTSSIAAMRKRAADKAVEGMQRENEQRDRLKAEIKKELAEDSSPGDVLIGARRESLRAQREPVVTRLRAIAERIEAHVDARKVEQPQWEPTVFDAALSDVANPNRREHDRELAAYRQETIGLYIRGDRAEALAAFDEAVRFLGIKDEGAHEVVRMPDGIPQLTLVPAVLQKVANALVASYEPQTAVVANSGG